MAFNCGVPPPLSKYSYADLGIMLNDPSDGCSSDDCHEIDDWMVTVKEKQMDNSEDLRDAIKSENFNKSYTYHEWLSEINDRYFHEEYDQMCHCLDLAYDNVDDPYAFVLHLLHYAHFDMLSKTAPINHYALIQMKKWKDKKVTSGKSCPKLSQQHQKDVLQFVCQKGYNYFHEANNVFELKNGDNSYLADVIRFDHLHSKKFKETVLIIQMLDLRNCFQAEFVMLPLLAFDQLQILEEYIEDSKELQKDYVNLLNDLCAMKEEEIQDYLSSKELVVRDSSKIEHKTLMKMAEKAVKRYNLNPDDFPDIFRSKNYASLIYLVKMRWKEEEDRNLSAMKKWEDLIEAAVRGKLWLQKKLVEKYLGCADLTMAVYWAKRLCMSLENVPPAVREELESTQLPQNSKFENEEEDWESELDDCPQMFSLTTGFQNTDLADDFLELKIKDVIVVDTIGKLYSAMKELFQSGQVIGFDAEWKPVFGKAGEQDKVSILQLATHKRVYILDMLKLYVLHSAEHVLKEFFRRFFMSPQVTKIGYGMVGDLKILIGMFAYMKEFILKSTRIVDLHDLSVKILNHACVQPHLHQVPNVPLKARGLGLLVRQVIGKRLNKAFQLSDWERRPLSEDQLHYAALDAYCLLQVYDRLHLIVQRTNIPVNMTEKVKIKWLKADVNPIVRVNKYEKRRMGKNRGAPHLASSMKFICDQQLYLLAQTMRKFGVDTVVMDTCDHVSSVIQKSHQENRAVLATRSSFEQICGHLAQGLCALINKEALEKQVDSAFDHYNLVVRSKDFFSRCAFCNSEDLLLIPTSELVLAYNLKHDIDNCEMPSTQTTPSQLINLSSFTLNNGVEILLDEGTLCCQAGTVDDETSVCKDCGNVDWVDIHAAFRARFVSVIDQREHDKTFYGRPG